LAAVVAVGCAGLLVGWIAHGDDESTTTVTRSTTGDGASGLPAAVERTRVAILHAAAARDYPALRRLVPRSGFTYSYGAPGNGGAVAYWRRLEATGARPLRTLATILKLPYSLRQGLYVWPFAYGLPRGELTRYERSLLGPLTRSYAGDDYYGWRAGIRPDGRWQFFVAGD
jgi:hypothetical protein